MNLDEKFLWFFGAIAVLLAIASVIGRILAKRAKTESSMSTIENLNQRVNAWWGMVIIFFVSYLLGGNATVILFGFISLFALREFITLTPTRLGDHNALFSAFFSLIPLQYVLIGTHWYSLFTLFDPSHHRSASAMVLSRSLWSDYLRCGRMVNKFWRSVLPSKIGNPITTLLCTRND